MDLRKLKTILEIFEESQHVSELEMTEGENRVRLRKTPSAPPVTAGYVAPPPPAAAPVADPAAPPAAANAPAAAETGTPVPAPMVGTFYRSSSPESMPFVRIGQDVEAGQTLCIIEAMKLMNEIPSPVAGKIKTICVENGAAIEYGQTLFILE